MQFSEFDTERNFDTVQILGGGRTEDTAVNIATLSGHGDEYTAKTFTSASNFMVIKFRSDGSVEKRGFRASWRTEAQSCGGDLVATGAPQVLIEIEIMPLDTAKYFHSVTGCFICPESWVGMS